MIQEIGMEKEEVEKGVIPVWKRYALTIAEAADYYHNRGKQTGRA